MNEQNIRRENGIIEGNPAIEEVQNAVGRKVKRNYRGGKYRRPLQERIEFLRKKSEGGMALPYIAEKMNMTYISVYCIAREHNIVINNNDLTSDEIDNIREKAGRKYKKINEGIDSGESLEKIAKRGTFGRGCRPVSREMVNIYIRATGQYNYWKACKEKRRKRGKLLKEFNLEDRSNIIIYLKNLIEESLASDSVPWEEKMAAICILKRKRIILNGREHKNIPSRNIVRLFRIYKKGMDEGKKYTLNEMSQKSGLHSASESRNLLGRVGLKALNATRTNNRYSESVKKALRNSADLPISDSDLAYFLGIKDSPMQQYRGNSPFNENRTIRPGNMKAISYEKASKIYEAIDAGFTLEETAEYSNSQLKAVNYVLENRSELEKILINVLHRLYPERNIINPYQ
ncbi:hypothetical protein J4461_03510 [Candidatus Pacearchaeota archaeon]|nr:hypothetical protein [Candidatus Pacearchaeota archaeon]